MSVSLENLQIMITPESQKKLAKLKQIVCEAVGIEVVKFNQKTKPVHKVSIAREIHCFQAKMIISDLTQKDIAESIGIHQSRVSRGQKTILSMFKRTDDKAYEIRKYLNAVIQNSSKLYDNLAS